MNYENDLIEQFQERGISLGSELYLPLEVALELVQWCDNRHLAVVGVEGFIWDSKHLMSQMDIIADFSLSGARRIHDWAEYVSKCNSLAKEYLPNISEREGLVINLTVLSEKEWMHYRNQT